MLGIMMNTNNYALTTAVESHFSVTRNNLYVLLNCQEDEIAKLLEKEIPRNMFELGLS